MGFSRQECWSGLPFPPTGDLPNPGIAPASLKSPVLAGGFFTPSATWEAQANCSGAFVASSVIPLVDTELEPLLLASDNLFGYLSATSIPIDTCEPLSAEGCLVTHSKPSWVLF